MLTLTGYQLAETLSEGVNTLVYSGIRNLDKKPVIIKILKQEYPTLEQIARLDREYKIAVNLNIEGIVKIYDLEIFQNRLALILEDFGGISLKQILSSQSEKFTSTAFLSLAIQIAKALESLHQNQIIHKDIKPANIIVNPQTGIAKIADFSIASLLSKETPAIGTPKQIEGTLAYMSPEQTGRMNRTLDYRTDFYSLGVTFYEILAGQLPFISNDPLEIIHYHIAKAPTALDRLNPDFPSAISEIILKLMAKNAEDRYQSARGLVVDLEICLNQLQTKGEITNFIPGQLDRSGQLLIPQKLYGRETEVNQLLATFERIIQGESEMMLVSGYSGIGKTSVINEVHKPIVRQRGYFIAGKFDQFKRNIPYAALIQAFGSLGQQLLAENPPKLLAWKQNLLAALGNNGQVIIDVIPEFELIIGKQPEVPSLGPTESQNRFNQVFKEFIRVFTQKDHPLVIFLDDLQWADSASLKLMELLIADAESQYLLLIGAYRDNEVGAAHPLIRTIEEIEKTGTVVNNIILKPLDLAHVNQLIAESLNDRDRVTSLAELIFNKTGGNPFFITQLLQALYQDKLLAFDFSRAIWQWSLEEIQAIGITDKSVVELVASRIEKLPEATQQVLKLAACVGDRFTLNVLSIVNEQSSSRTAMELWSALQAGLIIPLNENYRIPLVFDREESTNLTFDRSQVGYKFLHDRVQQAAHSLIPEDQKQATHLKIGKLLLQNTAPESLAENIFDIVNQLNVGIDYISDRHQKEELAKLNLMAGRKAKASAAYEPAVKYLKTGLELLAVDSWLQSYELTLNLYEATAEAEYLNINYEESKKLVNITLERAQTILEKVNVYELQIQSYNAQNRLVEAIDTGLKALKLLGISLPQNPNHLSIIAGLIDTKLRLARKGIEDLANLPTMTDPNKLAAMRILSGIVSTAIQAKPLLVPLLAFTMVKLCLRHGNSAYASVAYVYYGVILCRLGDFDSGYQFGQLAIALLEQFQTRELKCRVYTIFNCFLNHWKADIKPAINSLRDGFQSGLETGDREYAGYAISEYCGYIFLTGEPLDIVEREAGKAVNLMQQLKLEMALQHISIWRKTALNLCDDSLLDPSFLIGDSFNEVKMLPALIEAKSFLLVGQVYAAKSMLSYLFKDYSQALENCRHFEKYEEAESGLAVVTVSTFYHSLSLLALYPQASKKEQRQSLKKLAKYQKKLKKWAQNAPMNYQHKYELVEAEKARVLGDYVKAMNYYDRAIKTAKEREYIQDEALANERAAEFYFSRQQDKVACVYLTESYYGYIRWGAIAKVKDLEKQYPFLGSTTRRSPIQNLELTHTASSSGFSSELDIATFLKASSAIASEIVLENLLKSLIEILLENAAAQKGVIILLKDNQLFIEAAGEVTKDEVAVLQSLPVQTSQDLPISAINYVFITQKNLVLTEATQAEPFKNDPYIQLIQPKSILCSPILYQGKLTGILYLENQLTAGVFTLERLQVLKILTSQVAIALENAHLYTREQEKSQQLAQSLHKLQQTQSQLIQTEKISALGQLVAGIAHEVNNPVSFINGNLHHANQYIQDVIRHLHLYQQHYPHPVPEIQEDAETIELDYLIEDLPKLIGSMKMGTDRIRDIMLSLRNFSRLDGGEKKPVDIHLGLESTLMILQHRLKAKADRPAIRVEKEYGLLPEVACYPGQLNQVFMNLLANAIDVFDECNSKRTYAEIERNPNIITIRTELIEGNQVSLRIADNGLGMSESVKAQIFDPFFTTKKEGKGTGLGLSISYQIIVEKHGGKLQCISVPGQGTEFAITLPIYDAAIAYG